MNEIIIRSYKDAIEMICALSSCGLFNLESPNTGIKDLHMTVMKTTNNTIAMFVKELNNLIFAQESMKQELFNQAVKDLIDKYDIPISK